MPQLRLERGRPMGTADEAPTEVALGSSSVAPPYGQLKPGPGRPPGAVASHQRARINRAMIEVVVERGYRDATVREIARLAGISTRAFYEHYDGKEDCFLSVHQFMARRLLSRVKTSEAAAGNCAARLAAAVGAVIDEWGRSQKATCFFLFSPSGGGHPALEQARRTERSLGVMLGRHLVNGPESAELRCQIATGIVLGLASVTRRVLLEGNTVQQPGLRDQLTRWALTYQPRSPKEIEVLARYAERELAISPSSPVPSSNAEERDRAGSAAGDLALLHSAVARLAGSGDRGALSLRRVCTTAGVQRRSFKAHFADLEDCLAVAGDLRASLAVESVRRSAGGGSTAASRAYHNVAALSVLIARDKALASLCFEDLVSSEEWLARREQRLVDVFGGLLDIEDLVPYSLDRTMVQASLGAALGLLGGEVARGRAKGVGRKSPILAYLMLAPLIGASPTIRAIGEESVMANRA